MVRTLVHFECILFSAENLKGLISQANSYLPEPLKLKVAFSVLDFDSTCLPSLCEVCTCLNMSQRCLQALQSLHSLAGTEIAADSLR